MQSIYCKYGADNGLEELTIIRPSNLHAHLRDDAMLRATAKETMRPWKYLVVMPNTGPIDTIEKMLRYRDKLLRIRDEYGFETRFIMTLYFGAEITPRVVKDIARLGFPCAVKYYPTAPGATTGSGHGIPLTDQRARTALRAMEDEGIRFLIHGETVFDKKGNEMPQELREDYFMEHEFPNLRERFPRLDITIEHATTARAIEWVKADTSGRTICGITPQAMLHVRENLESITWGVHAKCMPIAKTPKDREAVLTFALSGDPRVHLGDDTAPHPAAKKNVSFKDAASGCFVPHSMALYIDIFLKHNKLDKLADFACLNGPKAWGLPLPDPSDTITFRKSNDLPEVVDVPEMKDYVVPFGRGNGIDPASDAHYPGFVQVNE